METRIQEYAAYLRKRGYKPNTVEAYLRDLRHFTTFLADEGINAVMPTRVTKTAVMAFTLRLRQEKRSAATTARMLSSVRGFFTFLQETGYVQRNPASEVRLPPAEREMAEVLTVAEINALLACADEPTPLGMRNRAMLELFYGSGLRVSELTALKVSDVNLRTGVVQGETRRLPVSAAAAQAVAAYLAGARETLLCGNSSDALFVNRSGEPLSRQGCWKLVRECARKAGITTVVTPQTLRNTLAAHWVENGADASAVRALLGMTGVSAAVPTAEMLAQTHPRRVVASEANA